MKLEALLAALVIASTGLSQSGAPAISPTPETTPTVIPGPTRAVTPVDPRPTPTTPAPTATPEFRRTPPAEIATPTPVPTPPDGISPGGTRTPTSSR